LGVLRKYRRSIVLVVWLVVRHRGEGKGRKGDWKEGRRATQAPASVRLHACLLLAAVCCLLGLAVWDRARKLTFYWKFFGGLGSEPTAKQPSENSR
jgi:hypothetical protein